MTHHNQTKELTSWFLNLLLDAFIDNKKHKVLSSNPRAHESNLEDWKAKKSSKRSSRRRKNRKANKRHEKRQTKEKSKEKLKIKKLKTSPETTPPNSLNGSPPPYRHYHVSSLNYPISKSSTNFVHNLFPFGNELIKHNLRKEWDAMHEIKIRVLHKVYK
jgi:flagellum-specific peptidoglycan hydrolase FlgJ